VGTKWDSARTAEGFDAYDDLPERVLGYPQVFRALRLDEPDVRRVLDYGCGPGKVAQRVVENFPVSVVGVDASPTMLDIAARERSHPRIEYHLTPDARLPFLADGSMDAAMSCYVFISIGSLEILRSIVSGVHRVLRPGARYAILDTNPDSKGIEFSTFRSGEPGTEYARGQQREVVLHLPDGSDFTLLDYYWPAETYEVLLREAGFMNIVTYRPVLGDVDPPDDERWRNEDRHAPFLVTVGQR